MCRLLGYLGLPISLESLLAQPSHSLIVQSYQPREMTAGLLNADGFGIGWYHSRQSTSRQSIEPFTYKNVLPIWNDVNLSSLGRYIESGCMVANIRSATPGQAIDLSNCQPFQHDQLLAIHNGYIDNFRQTLCRPIRQELCDEVYQRVRGGTDSEHIIALVVNHLHLVPDLTLAQALEKTLVTLEGMSEAYETGISANLVFTDGQQLVACRFACRGKDVDIPAPSLYWLRDDRQFPASVIVASEPCFEGDWTTFPEHSIITFNQDLTSQLIQL